MFQVANKEKESCARKKNSMTNIWAYLSVGMDSRLNQQNLMVVAPWNCVSWLESMIAIDSMKYE